MRRISQDDPYSPSDPSVGSVYSGAIPNPQAAQGPIVPGQPYQAPQPASTHTWDFGGAWNGNTFTPANGDWQAWFRQVMNGKPINQTTLRTLQNSLQQYGIQLSPENANHEITKIGLPDGSWVRVLQGDPNNATLAWVPQGSGSGAGAGAGGANPQAYQPFSQPFTPPPTLDLGGTNGLPYIPNAPSFNFTAPTPAQAAADPGYQFALKQGEDALTQSAAARGMLRTGGTLKDFVDYGQNAATQQYGNVYNRAFTLAQSQYAPLFSQWQTLAAAGQHQNDMNQSNAWQQYLDKENRYYDWQNMDWSRKFQLASA